MNQNLVQLNDKYAIATDENGEIKIISKGNNNYSHEDILVKENEIEDKTLKLKKVRNDLSKNKSEFITFLGIQVSMLSFASGIYVVTSALASSIIVPLLLTGAFAGLTETWLVQLAKKLHKSWKNNKELKKELEFDIPNLKRELNEVKEKVKYLVEYPVEEETILFKKRVKDDTLDNITWDDVLTYGNVSEYINDFPDIKVLKLKRKSQDTQIS